MVAAVSLAPAVTFSLSPFGQSHNVRAVSRKQESIRTCPRVAKYDGGGRLWTGYGGWSPF